MNRGFALIKYTLIIDEIKSNKIIMIIKENNKLLLCSISWGKI